MDTNIDKRYELWLAMMYCFIGAVISLFGVLISMGLILFDKIYFLDLASLAISIIGAVCFAYVFLKKEAELNKILDAEKQAELKQIKDVLRKNKKA
jgi:H+/Cl- antiporter ClcA